LTYFGGSVGDRLRELVSISPKVSQPIAMMARSRERMMPETTGMS
jgi:hypothetical protein